MNTARFLFCLILPLFALSCTKSGSKEPVFIFGSFRGEEQKRFEEIAKAFTRKTGYKVVYDRCPDFEVRIPAKIRSGEDIDIAALPHIQTLARFAEAGYIRALPDSIVSAIEGNYAPAWKDVASYKGRVYGVFHRANAKSFVWYNKKEWERRGYHVPQTLQELQELEDKMTRDGIFPWSIGFESGAASGWPGTDCLEDMLLRTASPAIYDCWTAQSIAMDAAPVREALERCGDIFLNEKYVYGGREGILSTNYGDSIRPLFEEEPKAMMNKQGYGAIAFLSEDVREKLAENVGVFALPGMTREPAPLLLESGDCFVACTDKPGVEEFLLFLTTWEACEPWAKKGGAVFPHRKQAFETYRNNIEREMAQILAGADTVRFDASEQMPSETGSCTLWQAMLDYASGTVSAEECLKNSSEKSSF